MSYFTWHPSNNHIALNRFFLLDDNLTLEEKGFLAFFMAVKDEWKFTKAFIAEYYNVSTAKITKMLDNLIKKEYVLLKKEDKDTYYCFLDVPQDKLNGTILNCTTKIEQLQKLNLPDKKRAIAKTKKVKEYDLFSIEYKLACKLYNKIKLEDPAMKEPNLHSWAGIFNTMIWVNKTSYGQIDEAIDWCFKNKYWRSAISSPERLRWSWGTIRKQMNNGKNCDINNTEKEINDWLNN